MKLLLILALGVLSVSAEESQDALEQYRSINTLFTADVYKELAKTEAGNFLVCPLSVNLVLALAHAGANGNTAQELSTGLHLPNNKDQIQHIFTKLAPHLKGNDKYTLNSANKVYVKDGYAISDSFKATAVDTFNAEVQNIDFEKTVQAAAEMNKWVEEQTHDKIKDLVSPDDLNEYTFSVLINALYFHGNWVTKFNEHSTHKRSFYKTNSEQVQIDMMDQTNRFNYYECSEAKAQFIEIPYEGDDITMNIVLPNDKEGLSALEAKIGEVIAAPKYQKEFVHLVLPKFKIETTIDFNTILDSFGIKQAFTDSADFTGIGKNKDLIKITKVIQKAFIEVEEKGTTAAAASAVHMGFIRSGMSLRPEPKQFIADHPFIYYLKSSTAGILFIGRFSQG